MNHENKSIGFPHVFMSACDFTGFLVNANIARKFICSWVVYRYIQDFMGILLPMKIQCTIVHENSMDLLFISVLSP